MSRLLHYLTPHQSNNQRAKILHPSFVFLLIVSFGLFQILITKSSPVLPQILGYAANISPTEIVRLSNQKRSESGLASLNMDSQLNQAAAQKAADMIAKDYWAHVSPTGTQPWFFITQSGYSYRYAGENLARDFSDPGSVVTAWMNSPTHKENLLNTKYQDIGVAVVDGTLGGRETTLVVQMFGTKLSATAALPKTTALAAKASEPSPTPVRVLATTPVTTITPTLFLPSPTLSPTLTPTPTSFPAFVSAGVSSYQPPATPFAITKAMAIFIFGVLCLALIIDLIIVNRRRIVRWTGKSFAHFIYLSILMVAAALLIQGQII